MYKLLSVIYGGAFKAREVRKDLQRKQQAFLSEIEDAVVVEKRSDGTIEIDHMHPLNVGERLGDNFLGNLLDLVFHRPEPGDHVRHLPDEVKGALRDVGITDGFMKQTTETLEPGQAMLFVLACPGSSDKIVKELSEDGVVTEIALSHRDSDLLKIK